MYPPPSCQTFLWQISDSVYSHLSVGFSLTKASCRNITFFWFSFVVFFSHFYVCFLLPALSLLTLLYLSTFISYRTSACLYYFYRGSFSQSCQISNFYNSCVKCATQVKCPSPRVSQRGAYDPQGRNLNIPFSFFFFFRKKGGEGNQTIFILYVFRTYLTVMLLRKR